MPEVDTPAPKLPLGIDGERSDLFDEFMARPFGRHSPDLQSLLDYMRGSPIVGKYFLLMTKSNVEWMLARFTEGNPLGVERFPSHIFGDIEEAERYVFGLRWAALFGHEPPTGEAPVGPASDGAESAGRESGQAEPGHEAAGGESSGRAASDGEAPSWNAPGREAPSAGRVGFEGPELLAYADRQTLRAGEEIEFKVSCSGVEEYRLDIVRLLSPDMGDGPDVPPYVATELSTPVCGNYPARHQGIYPGSYVRIPPPGGERPEFEFVRDARDWPESDVFDFDAALESDDFDVEAAVEFDAGLVPWHTGGFSVILNVFPTLLVPGIQMLFGTFNGDTATGAGLFLTGDGNLGFVCRDSAGGWDEAHSDFVVAEARWTTVALTCDGAGRVTLAAGVVPSHRLEDRRWEYGHHEVDPVAGLGGSPIYIGGTQCRDGVWDCFNGRIERPRLFGRALEPAEIEAIAFGGPAEPASAVLGPEVVLGDWDFSVGISSEEVRDVSGNERHGTIHNLPTRGVGGSNWSGRTSDWRVAPEEYGAIHFHDDDISDACWDTTQRLRIPADWPSGCYAARLRAGEATETVGTGGGRVEGADTGGGAATGNGGSEGDGGAEGAGTGGAAGEGGGASGAEFWVPFGVRPAAGGPTAEVAFLLPTATYGAYANLKLRVTSPWNELIHGRLTVLDETDLLMLRFGDIGACTYDSYRDGSTVVHSSMHRPVTNFRPHGRMYKFCQDLLIVAWLERSGYAYDVISDDDVDREGADALAPYRVLVTSSHPEYTSTPMMDAFEGFVRRGGRLMTLGGNVLWHRIAYHPTRPGITEVRRPDLPRLWRADASQGHDTFTGEAAGTWVGLGRAPHLIAGVGFITQGFDACSYYRRTAASRDPRAAFIFEGIDDELIGDFGILQGGAAGYEIERVDAALGTPAHALVVASSEGHSNLYGLMVTALGDVLPNTDPEAPEKIRADMVFFETPGGGAVFSVGSIAWSGSLSHAGYDNNVAAVTANVLKRFADPDPFTLPTPAAV